MDFLSMSICNHCILPAWIHWNPNPTVFFIPYFNHPLRWYGLLFALGFAAGFMLLLPLLKQKLAQTRSLMARDVANWTKLTKALQTAIKDPNSALGSFLKKLSNQTIKKITNVSTPPSSPEQTQLLNALNEILLLPSTGMDRTKLEQLFPNAINSIGSIAYSYIDRLLWFIVIGTVIGARLGHVFLYEWPRYSANPGEIIKIWEGGLASHGGFIGVLLAVFLYIRHTKAKFPEISFLGLCDLLVIPTTFVIVCIRLGNFVNQEILGTVSSLPWAVVFGHPADGSPPIPRHPVQLYEAIAYFALFIFCSYFWRLKSSKLPPGYMLGLAFFIAFSTRFFLEFLKESQSMMIDESWVQTSQLLSIPFIFFGIGLMYLHRFRKGYKKDPLPKQLFPS